MTTSVLNPTQLISVNFDTGEVPVCKMFDSPEGASLFAEKSGVLQDYKSCHFFILPKHGVPLPVRACAACNDSVAIHPGLLCARCAGRQISPKEGTLT